jgi:hypothetical protein
MDDFSVHSVLNNSSASGLTTGYTYNGLGDRLSQFKSGVTTSNVGLVLFGRSRI